MQYNHQPRQANRTSQMVKNVGFVEAFKNYGAELKNPNWAVSSISVDGSLVISCWSSYFKSITGRGLVYFDNLRRWGGNPSGNNLLREHLTKAFQEKLPVRLVVAKPDNVDDLETTTDASKIKKKFFLRPEVVGRVTHFNGDDYEIDFAPYRSVKT